MPFQQINFAGIKPIGRPWLRDLIPSLMQGYVASQVPGQMQREAQQQQLANAMANLKLQEEPQMFQANLKGKDLANAFQSMLNQEQPTSFKTQQAQAALAQKLLNEKITKAHMMNDPNLRFNYQNTLTNLLLGGPSGNSPSVNTSAPNVQVPFKADNLTITPEAANNLTTSGIATTAPSGYTQNAEQGLDAWQQLMRQSLGYPAQTPEEKNAAKLQLFRQEQAIKAGMPTTQFLTQNQQSIQAIDSIVPDIQNLKNMAIPGALLGKLPWNADAQASYKAQIAGIKDRLVKGLGLKPNDKAIEMIDDIASIKPFEDRANYNKRLDAFVQELGRIRGLASNNMTPGMFGKSAVGNVANNDPLGIR